MSKPSSALLLLVVLAFSHIASADNSPRPNILLIVADDLGFTDLGVYGGEIHTPNIDALASAGTLFTQFHTAPMCAPTRAMLLSGNNNHVAGVASQSQLGIRGHSFPGYEAGLSNRIAPLPRVLQQAGYATYAVGKWHLGIEDAQSPTAAGFDRSWMMLDGAGTHYDGVGFENAPSTFWHDGAYTDYPVGVYATAWYTDQLLNFIDSGSDNGKPFFAYAAFTSPHWPLQLPDAYRDLYAGRYDNGYDVLRVQRLIAAKRAGVIAADHALPPRNSDIVPWDSLPVERQRVESRKMELYAAMVHNLDEHVGRIVEYLRAKGLYENTLIVFMSDNGAAAEDFFNEGPFTGYLQERFDNRYENMGTRSSFVSHGPQWAEATSAPFSRHKTFAREGGIVAPMIVSGAAAESTGVIDHSYVTVMDLAPTTLEAAGVVYPESESIVPPEGASLLPYLRGSVPEAHTDSYVTTLYHRGVALLRQGPWKLVTLAAPFDESKFALFNIAKDPGETQNLAVSQSAKYEELIALWRLERKRLGIVLPQDL